MYIRITSRISIRSHIIIHAALHRVAARAVVTDLYPVRHIRHAQHAAAAELSQRTIQESGILAQAAVARGALVVTEENSEVGMSAQTVVRRHHMQDTVPIRHLVAVAEEPDREVFLFLILPPAVLVEVQEAGHAPHVTEMDITILTRQKQGQERFINAINVVLALQSHREPDAGELFVV